MKKVTDQGLKRIYLTPEWNALEIKPSEVICQSGTGGGGSAGGGGMGGTDLLKPWEDPFQTSELPSFPSF